MSKASILLIVEGESMDRKIMDNLLKVYNFEEKYEIYSYNTNIYDLYDKMFSTDDDLDTLDILQVLKEKEKDISKKEIFDNVYSDIILVFDYDPQDYKYSNDKIIKLQSYFNESTDNGKLYLNYPMIEAFKHLCNFPDNDYINRVVEMNELRNKQYKNRVGSEGKITQISKYDRKKCNEVIVHNLIKANYILNNNSCNDIENKELYRYIDFDKILEKQSLMLTEEQKFYVLSTCQFYILDYNSRLVFD